MKQILKSLSLLLVFALLTSLCACGLAENAKTVTVTDHAGNTVEVPAEINRVVVLNIYPLPSVLAVFFNSAEKIVGMPQQSMAAAKNGLLSQLYPEILNAETGYIDGTNVNAEELMKLEPDVVFYNAGDSATGEMLAELGIPGVAISAGKWGYDAIETLNHWIETLSQLFPGNDRARKVADYSAQAYDRVRERVADIPDDERQKLFFLFQYGDTGIATGVRRSFGQYWADAIGAVNVAEEIDADNFAGVTMEQIYDWNPQRILITNFNTASPDDLYGNTVGSYDWSVVDAVINRQATKMPLGMYRSYTCGVDTPVTLLWMAKTVYPALFDDIDITEETRNYYREVFGIELTPEQAEMIFAPAEEASAF